MTSVIFTMPANHESKLWELFPLHPHCWTASIPLLFWEQGDFIFPLIFFVLVWGFFGGFCLFCFFFFFPLFLSNQLSADHPSHFSLCPRILWTIVLIPSVLSIKALVISSEQLDAPAPHTDTPSGGLFGYNYAELVLISSSCLQMPFMGSPRAAQRNVVTQQIGQCVETRRLGWKYAA